VRVCVCACHDGVGVHGLLAKQLACLGFCLHVLVSWFLSAKDTLDLSVHVQSVVCKQCGGTGLELSCFRSEIQLSGNPSSARSSDNSSYPSACVCLASMSVCLHFHENWDL